MPPRFRYLEPTFFAGLLDDPLLYLRIRPLGRALLFDCGRLHHLAKRVLRSLDAVFVSHAHMDHFMGIDTLVRSIHVAPRTLRIFGPPGLAAKLSHKLRGYDWNLCEPWWGSLLVHEFDGHCQRSFHFSGPEGFPCRPAGTSDRPAGVLEENPYLKVRAALGDHKIPVLAFRIDEQPGFAIDADRLQSESLVTGSWVAELRRRFARGWQDRSPLPVLRRSSAGCEAVPELDPEALFRRIGRTGPTASIGYLTDIGFTPGNRSLAEKLLGNLTLLVCECSFLGAEQERAGRSGHLSSRDLSELLDSLRPRYVLPMHLSKLYLGRGEELYRELRLPAGTELLRLPEHLLPAPLLPRQVGFLS